METKQSQTASDAAQENIMGTMEVHPLLIRLSVPMMISMLVQALYGVTDAMFVYRIGETSLDAVALSAALQGVMTAVGIGTGVGVSALLSKNLGEKKEDRISQIAENGLFLALCSYAVFVVVGLTCLRPYFNAQTKDAAIVQQGIRYLSVCCILSLGLFVQTMGERLLTATGRTSLSMICQLAGAVTNIVLDPIFIFGYCGPALAGPTGAALATVIGQSVSAGLTMYFNIHKNPDVALNFKGFRPSGKVIRRIYEVGLPSIAMQCISSVQYFILSGILMGLSETAVTVYSIYSKLQGFVYMPVSGLSGGMAPIVGYNCGARKPDRIKKAIRLSLIYAEIIMALGVVIFVLLTHQLLDLFHAEGAMLAIGIPALRILCPNLLLIGLRLVINASFQALGNGLYSLIALFSRQLLVLLPAAWLLSRTGNVNNVWWAFLLAELVGLVLNLFFCVRINKTVIAPLSEPVRL